MRQSAPSARALSFVVHSYLSGRLAEKSLQDFSETIVRATAVGARVSSEDVLRTFF